MKEFNLEEAKAGAKIITRSGRKARILCFDRVDELKHGSIIALITNEKSTWERPVLYNNEGHCATAFESAIDLMIDDRK